MTVYQTTSNGSLRELFDVWLSEFNIQAIYRQNDPGLWLDTCEKLAYFPVTYSSANIDYQMAYHKVGNDFGRVDIDLLDISIVLLNDNKPCGVWPLTITQNSLTFDLSSYGNPVLPPLFIENLSTSTIKRISRSCIDVFEHYCKKNMTKDIINVESGHCNNGLSEWHKYLMGKGAIPFVQHELYLDLSLDLSVIKSGFRKSYKSLVTSGGKIWDAQILDSDSGLRGMDIWNEYRNLHFQVSDRATRSKETWDMQYQQIVDGLAFLVYLRDGNKNMIGGGFFNLTKDEGCYLVGAYERSLCNKPLGHVVQWYAIQEMKRRSLRWYSLGRRFYPADTSKEKEISISVFKEGFSTHVQPKILLEWCNTTRVVK